MILCHLFEPVMNISLPQGGSWNRLSTTTHTRKEVVAEGESYCGNLSGSEISFTFHVYQKWRDASPYLFQASCTRRSKGSRMATIPSLWSLYLLHTPHTQSPEQNIPWNVMKNMYVVLVTRISTTLNQ